MDGERSKNLLGYGLISSYIAVKLSDKIDLADDPVNSGGGSERTTTTTTTSSKKFIYNNDTEIDWLPTQYEPGSWSYMPDDDNDWRE